MADCTVCGLPMLHDGVEYYDGQLVTCGDGHVAMVSHDAGSDPEIIDAEMASEWVLRFVHAFSDKERRDDVRTIAAAVMALERRAEEAADEEGAGRD